MAQLPLPSDGVRHVEVELRTVERAVALVDRVRLLRGFERQPKRRFGVVPRRDLAQELLGPRRQLHRILQAEVAVDALHESQQPLDFLGDLRLHHETVRIVLRELADPRETREHAGRFVSVQRRLLVEAGAAGPVAADLAGEHQEMARAVHRLQAHFFVVRRLHEEHVLAVVRPVAGRFPQRLVEDDAALFTSS